MTQTFEVSPDLCEVHFDMRYADTDVDCAEFVRGRRTGRGRKQVEHRVLHDEWPTTALRRVKPILENRASSRVG